MQASEADTLVAAEGAIRHAKEVAVTRGVAATEGERANQVDADQSAAKDRRGPSDESRQEIVQLSERRRRYRSGGLLRAVLHAPTFADARTQ